MPGPNPNLTVRAPTRIAFADESGTDGATKCYAIGVVSVAKDRLKGLEKWFCGLKAKHGVTTEVHWKKVDKGHGLINLCIDCLHQILLSETGRFDVMVVNTAQYRKWNNHGSDREAAFYQTYTFLVQHIARETRETAEVLIDDRSDSYSRRHEAMEAIGNNMLARLPGAGSLQVRKVSSREHPGVQIADILTGAIRASHLMNLDPSCPLNAGKRLTIQRMASLLGWDGLHYDTMPHSRFNIWHFPKEYRAVPETRKIAPIAGPPRYVSLSDLETFPSAAADARKSAEGSQRAPLRAG